MQSGEHPDEFKYNADGLLTERIFGDDSSIRSLWDFQNVLRQEETFPGTKTLYTLNPKLYGNLVSQLRDSTSHFHLFDALGSNVALADGAQSVGDLYVYKAHGQPLFTFGSTVNPFRWVGRVGYQFDSVLNQYYVRARHYGPVTARWMSQDPLGYHGSFSEPRFVSLPIITLIDDVQLESSILSAPKVIGLSDLQLLERNTYQYAISRPTQLIDPSGYYAIAVPGGLAALGAFLAGLPAWVIVIGIVIIGGIVYGVTAERVRVEDGAVKLRRADGKVISVPIARLSKADQQFVQQQALNSPKPLDSVVRIVAPAVPTASSEKSNLPAARTGRRIVLD